MNSKNVTSADNQQVRSKEEIDQNYFAGFIDGEGCFYIGFSRRNDLPLGWQIITEFHLSQNPGGRNVLEAFSNRISCGYIKANHPKNPKDKTYVLIIKDRRDIENKLLPFFKNNQLHTSKKNDLEIFKKVISLIKQRHHLTKEGFREIVEIVFQTNRKTNKKYTKQVIISSLA